MLDVGEDVNGTNDDANISKKFSNIESRRVPGGKANKKCSVPMQAIVIWFVSEWGPGVEIVQCTLSTLGPLLIKTTSSVKLFLAIAVS